MDFSPTDLQRELAAGTRELLAAQCPPATVRAAWDKPAERSSSVRADGTAGPVWAALAELGLPGALVPEPAGGLALTVSDVLPALAETGWAAVPAPVVETALVAVPLLAAVGGHDALLGAVAAGETVLTAELDGGPVPYSGVADHALLATGAGVRLVGRTELDAAEPVAAVDGSRPLAHVRPAAGELLTDDPALLAAARHRGALGTGAQLLGLAHRQLELTVDHVAQRRQFGAPVGSFQAVKHQLADVLLGVRFAEPAVRRAGLSVDDGADTTDRDVAMAKSMASEAADRVARTAIQCHGAIGYTDEYDLSLYAKRTWALVASWGTAAQHRAVYADALGLPRSA